MTENQTRERPTWPVLVMLCVVIGALIFGLTALRPDRDSPYTADSVSRLRPDYRDAMTAPIVTRHPDGSTTATAGPIPEIPPCHGAGMSGRIIVFRDPVFASCWEGVTQVNPKAYCLRCHVEEQ